MTTAIRNLKCPQCKRSLPGIVVGDEGELTVRRTCPKCKTQWRVVASLLRRDDAKAMHKLDWEAL